MSKSIDIDKVSAVIVEAAETLILPRFKMLQASEIATKSGPNDLVTIADREAEAFLDGVLPKMYPGTVLIGEESISEGTKSLDALHQKDQLVWVTDPVDGTSNFVHGKDEFAVMLAAVLNGEILHGWIYDVIGKKMMTTSRGGGAWFGGERMKTAASKPLHELSGHVGWKYYPEALRPFLKEQTKKVGNAFSLNCAGHEYLMIADGKADFGIYSRAKPWDHLAGTLAVQEAGGYVSLWNGQPYYPSFTGHGLMAASSPEVAEELRGAFLNRFVEILAEEKSKATGHK